LRPAFAFSAQYDRSDPVIVAAQQPCIGWSLNAVPVGMSKLKGLQNQGADIEKGHVGDKTFIRAWFPYTRIVDARSRAKLLGLPAGRQ
jgi:hypothetical protein